MAEISEPNPISPAPSVEPKGKRDTEQPQSRAEKEGDSAPEDAPGRDFGDQASILGIPEAELTPMVQAAMSALMSRAARLMEEAEQLREQAAYLEDLSDRDPLLPVLNRRALLRELAQVLAQAEQTETTSSFLYLGACAVEVLMLGDWRATAGEVGSWPEYRHLAGPTLGWKSHTGRRNARDSCFLRARWALRAAEPVRWRTRTCLSTWPASPSA